MTEELLIEAGINLRTEPKNINLLDNNLKEIFYKIRFQNTPIVKLLKFKNIKIDNKGVIYKKNNQIYLDHHEYSEKRVLNNEISTIPMLADWYSNPFITLKKLVKKILKKQNKTQFLKDAVTINTNDTYLYFSDTRSQINFYHWFIDALVRLLLVNKDIKYSLILSNNQKENLYVQESLEILGINKNKIIYLEENQVYEFKKIHIVTTCIYAPGACIPYGIILLKEKFLHNGTPKRNIYLERKAQHRRSFVNNDELHRILQDFHFEKIIPEEYSLSELIKIMSSADIMMGVHGAGLTHMLFMQRNTNLIEIAPIDFINKVPKYWGNKYLSRYSGDCYYSLANACNLNYYLVSCDSIGNNKNTLANDLYLDTKLLRQTLLMINNYESN